MLRRAAVITLALSIFVLSLISFRSVAFAATVTSTRSGTWSDAATWGGRVPAAGDAVVIGQGTTVTLTGSAQPGGVTIQPGGTLRFSPDSTGTLESSANVTVNGRLEMKPASHAVKHTLRFTGINEAAMKGGGMVPIASDTGLWVMGAGQVDLAGSPKSTWTRTTGSIAGATSMKLETTPAGWQAGDELVIAPTETPTVGDASWSGFDETTLASQTGNTINTSSPMKRAHPVVASAWRPEIMNLTRNVRIEGTATGRTHVFFHSTSKSAVSYAQIRHVGPQKTDDGNKVGVLGRYGLHFHMMNDASRGMQLIGNVVRDAGSHAFVAHQSHGITFKDAISYNTFDDAYWWDTNDGPGTDGPETNNTVYDHCIAAKVKWSPDFRGYRLSGFSLLQGSGNEVRDSTAVGVQGNVDASGFQWPESSGKNGTGLWKFDTGNVAHNNKIDGIFAWQNEDKRHLIKNLVTYHNGEYGIDHGAYGNIFNYDHVTAYGNLKGAVNNKAAASFDKEEGRVVARQQWTNMLLDGGGISKYLLVSDDHNTDESIHNPTLFLNSVMRGYSTAAVHMGSTDNPGHNQPYAYDLVKPGFAGKDAVFDSQAPSASFIRVQDGNTAYKLTKAGKSTIQPFYTGTIPNETPGAPALQPVGDVAVPAAVPANGNVRGASTQATPTASSGGLLPDTGPVAAVSAGLGITAIAYLSRRYWLGRIRLRKAFTRRQKPAQPPKS